MKHGMQLSGMGGCICCTCLKVGLVSEMGQNKKCGGFFLFGVGAV